MLNESKIRLMTRMTLSEEHQDKESRKAEKYYKSDYIHLKIITTVISVTIAFLLLAAMVAFYNMEALLAELLSLDYKELGLKILGYYVCLIVVYVVFIVLCTIVERKEDGKRKIAYLRDFKALKHMYEKEEER